MCLWGLSPTCFFRQIGNLPYGSMARFQCRGQLSIPAERNYSGRKELQPYQRSGFAPVGSAESPRLEAMSRCLPICMAKAWICGS